MLPNKLYVMPENAEGADAFAYTAFSRNVSLIATEYVRADLVEVLIKESILKEKETAEK